MLLSLNLESENFEELTEKIIDKYLPINNDQCDIEIREFATSLKGLYQKFYPQFLKTQYQHGMYLALVNVTPSNITDFHEEYRTENHKIFWEEDRIQNTYIASSVFEALLTNLRKLTTDLSWGKSEDKSQSPPRAVSMKRIAQDIGEFHKRIGANSCEFTVFENNLNSLIIDIESGEDLEKLWRYTDKHNIHLEDQYSLEDDNMFPLVTLRTTINTIMRFINTIYEFYNYKEPAHIMDIGHNKTQKWIESFSSYKVNSLRILREYIDAIASFCNNANYADLDPEEASRQICEWEIFGNESHLEELKLRIELALKKKIEELRD